MLIQKLPTFCIVLSIHRRRSNRRGNNREEFNLVECCALQKITTSGWLKPSQVLWGFLREAFILKGLAGFCLPYLIRLDTVSLSAAGRLPRGWDQQPCLITAQSACWWTSSALGLLTAQCSSAHTLVYNLQTHDTAAGLQIVQLITFSASGASGRGGKIISMITNTTYSRLCQIRRRATRGRHAEVPEIPYCCRSNIYAASNKWRAWNCVYQKSDEN